MVIETIVLQAVITTLSLTRARTLKAACPHHQGPQILGVHHRITYFGQHVQHTHSLTSFSDGGSFSMFNILQQLQLSIRIGHTVIYTPIPFRFKQLIILEY
ncbi:hypothetical protein F5Y16DRAFT_154436 [Xylariaceae sp. FL0255]|nr:hypothetical protein F5Y16DRAFT_154436 [Xylariaceae sp. FL0255]